MCILVGNVKAHSLLSFFLSLTLSLESRSGSCCYSHLADEETKIQRSSPVTCYAKSSLACFLGPGFPEFLHQACSNGCP